MLMFSSTYHRKIKAIADLFDKEEFSGAETLEAKAELALARLEEHRGAQFRNRQKALTLRAILDDVLKERDAARIALRDIIAMETDKCAHIGKRMAARAREAMPAAVEAEVASAA
jgi:hypothetical protein